MGKALADAFPICRDTFAEADQAVGEPLSRLIFDGPEDQLTLTENAQPSILAVSTAACRLLESRGVTPAFVAGHSLGEYSANVAAGTFEFGDALRMVRRRGRYMQEAVPVGEGAMAAILGLDAATVAQACVEQAHGEVVGPANLNGAGQIVIAGARDAVRRAGEQAKSLGAKRVIPLPVSAPFHCALMMPAQERLARDLEAITFSAPKVPLVNNVDAAVVRGADAGRDGLVRQVSGTVRWQESVERLVREGVDTFVEVGPGTVLSGLVKKIDKNVRVLGVEDPASLEATTAALQERRTA